MVRRANSTDSVRASRDGHEYHEAWTARKAMQLLLPDDHLIGIAVEGLEPTDQARASAETVEVADLTLYYGKNAGFRSADRVDVVQFKYSVSRENVDFRASDAKKTIEKFAASYLDYRKTYGAKLVEQKLKFELIINRPIYPALTAAIDGLCEGKGLLGKAEEQARQFKAASGLDGKTLAAFARKCLITGLSGNLTDAKRDLSRILVDWSATTDALATSRLGQMRDMVRKKAGHAGTHRNVIRSTDVLAALDLPDVETLLPCPASLTPVGEVVKREQLQDAASLIPKLTQPLLVHAAGGVGKTVFMESLAKTLQDRYEIVFFDCFGGGAYRSPEDARHLPKRGLVHIANSLARRALCDPVLPGSDDRETLLKTFRRRLEQCVTTLSRGSADKEIILFLDAIDNAAEHAHDRHEDSFPTLLAKSFHIKPVTGVKLVVSSRSHRIPIKDIPYHDFELRPFSQAETETYLRARLPKVAEVEIRVAQARSDGNPRILEYLLNSGRGLLDPSEIDNKIELNDLIQARLDSALSEAMKRGYKAEDTDAFLAGLAVLPPPVPLDEYAEAHGMRLSEIESFVSDLCPLLERTKHGLMFHDEPTETLVRDNYASIDEPLRRVASNLLARQKRSVYAARALPGLLQKLGDGQQLFKLAFDDRFPASITSTVGKRNIRYARLKAAVRYAANQQNYDQLVHLLVELSTIAAVDRRGADYILDYPDLVIAAQDVDATRRLFETRTVWQGTRHARLTIAHALSGDSDEASRHAVCMNDWLYHYWQQDRDDRPPGEGPERLDIAALPFFLITQNRYQHAVGSMRRWKDWYAYEVGEHLFGLLQQRCTACGSVAEIDGFLDGLTNGIGAVAAALSFVEMGPRQKELVEKLARACTKATKLETSEHFHRGRAYQLQDGLRKASAIALSLGLGTEAAAIALRAPHRRPAIWSFRDQFADQYVFPFLFDVALTAAIKGTEVRERNILPKELVPIARGMKGDVSGAELGKNLKQRLENQFRTTRDASDTEQKKISSDQKHEAERFIDERLAPSLELTKALSALLGAPAGKADNAFLALLTAWVNARNTGRRYGTEKLSYFFQMLGCQIATFALWARSDLKAASVRAFLKRLHEQEIVAPSTLIEVVATLARRKPFQTLAGQEAIKVLPLIESENDVTHRASLYADLARAILPASTDEAATYFKAGLDQMDAIGSGDYEFTNELLLFASSLRGDELDEQDFHTLSNICELNLTDEPGKFYWFAFGKAMSRVASCRALAKLSRWDDRSKVSLKYTLLPYLTALVDDGKIQPEDALALNRLADPVEFFNCDTATFATAIDNKGYPNDKALITELLKQFEENNPGVPMDSTVETLAAIAERVLGKTSETATYLAKAHPRFAKVRDEHNDHINYHGRSYDRSLGQSVDSVRQNKTKLQTILNRTIPTDETSLRKAINDLYQINDVYSVKGEFFDKLRAKVPYPARAVYIRILLNLESLNLYVKLDELQKCKESWATSSAALTDAYQALAVPMLHSHADDLLSGGQLSGYKLKEISELSGASIPALALELVKLYAEPDSSVPAAVWLALACFMCDEAREGEGQAALKRLLNSDAAKLSATVIDGAWKKGSYPRSDPTEICSGFVWRMLGSLYAADRWRAAHGVRCFARFGRWNIVDALVGKLSQKDAGPFQAAELPFYFMHAKLWLLIALARISLDDPKGIAQYKDVLFQVVRDESHVLMRHFAARALRAAMDAQKISLPEEEKKLIKEIDLSPKPRLRKKLKNGGDFYRGRPKTAPKPKSEFHLDYDFHKHDVQNLSRVFGKPGWEVQDLLSDIVSKIDPDITSMYKSGGREISYRNRLGGMTSSFHTHGQQLGWHALFIAAGQLLRQYPVTDDWFYNDDPWGEWLRRYLLTRTDGLWLSDGVDRPPLEVADILLEKDDDGLVITGDKAKILGLAGLDCGVGKKTVVAGSWHSTDHIRVHISSVLVASRKARALAKKLIGEEPMLVWLPEYDEAENDQEYLTNNGHESIPWVVRPSREARLDEDDPIGSMRAMLKPRIARTFAEAMGLRADDPFGRVWTNPRGGVMAQSEAWGHENKYSDEPSSSGVRLWCSRALLKSLLTKNNADLLLLVNLQRYQKQYRHSFGKYTHTVAVIRIKKSLDIEYHKGRINHLHKFRY